MVKPWHDEFVEVWLILITPGLDPRVLSGGNKDGAMVKPWHVGVTNACEAQESTAPGRSNIRSITKPHHPPHPV